MTDDDEADDDNEQLAFDVAGLSGSPELCGLCSARMTEGVCPYCEQNYKLPYSNDGTSKAAAKRMEKSGGARAARERVLVYLETQGRYGTTCEQCELATGLSHQTCSPRFGELRSKKHGYVMVPTGIQRRTASGSYADVYMHRKFLRHT